MGQRRGGARLAAQPATRAPPRRSQLFFLLTSLLLFSEFNLFLCSVCCHLPFVGRSNVNRPSPCHVWTRAKSK
ncbi:hypothetical protein IF1G_08679 [Cordyceps javanica]|uniref:Uncharacterized protein n=1 Tax=Cordyceps javanica TaxID=43265 RepID=A0A545VNK9_9HYPO|nr:hypothetical protein IF1G_08679 [Cordyceps javanica]TQW03284.1 hypothetical protein IF2G_09013 [Cordyceps javanica]